MCENNNSSVAISYPLVGEIFFVLVLICPCSDHVSTDSSHAETVVQKI